MAGVAVAWVNILLMAFSSTAVAIIIFIP